MPISSASSMAVILLALTPFLFSITSPQVQALNITGIPDKAGGYTIFIRLLASTQVTDQITNDLLSSSEGLTVLAPTDKAFRKLKGGTLNSLSTQEQVELVLFHVLPKYYSMSMFGSVSNPVRTEATGLDGGAFRLNFTQPSRNQIDVSSGVTQSPLKSILSKYFPLAMYQVNQVSLPVDMFEPSTDTPADKYKKLPPARYSYLDSPTSSPAPSTSDSVATSPTSGNYIYLGSPTPSQAPSAGTPATSGAANPASAEDC